VALTTLPLSFADYQEILGASTPGAQGSVQAYIGTDLSLRFYALRYNALKSARSNNTKCYDSSLTNNSVNIWC
jgi:hypothetical protein